jgi:PIN domain nuclease of toxin-antitoxin system
MTLLLVAHAFLFAGANRAKLSEKVRETLARPDVPRFLSVVSLWEIRIKSQTGKLPAPASPSFFEDQSRDLGARLLPLDARHIRALGDLPMHHKDPFDRMLIAQARAEGITLVSREERFSAYDVPTLW